MVQSLFLTYSMHGLLFLFFYFFYFCDNMLWLIWYCLVSQVVVMFIVSLVIKLSLVCVLGSEW